MARRGRVPLRLDIVGLDPQRFQESLKNAQALVESKTKGSSVSRAAVVSPANSAEESYSKIALIALDFQRAYGRAVEIRVFERSANKFFEKMMGSFSRRSGSGETGGSARVPEFFVNGVRIYRGVPTSFSQLDEAIENAFGRA